MWQEQHLAAPNLRWTRKVDAFDLFNVLFNKSTNSVTVHTAAGLFNLQTTTKHFLRTFYDFRIVFLRLEDDVQSVLRSLSPQCLWASHDEMQIDLIRYEQLTLSLRRILNSFSNSFLEFYSYEGFPSSDIRKNEAYSFASIMVVDMKLWIYFM